MIDKKLVCYTLEPKDNFNIPFKSCIPEGNYICEKIHSPKYGNTFKVKNVKNRSNILFHWGNTYKDTQGCIITGKHVGKLGKDRAVLSSREAFKGFIKKVNKEEQFNLEIINNY